MNYFRWLVFLLGGAAAAGCSERAPGTGGGDVVTVVDTAGGVVHVRNSGVPATWVAEPLVRIGAVEGGPAEFGRIRSILAGEDGSIYVADNLASEVRVFAADGAHLRTFGRQGAGPGEFGDLYSLAWLGDELAAMDPRNARIARLSRDGTWVDGLRFFPLTGPSSLVRLHPLGRDGFYTPVIVPGREGGIPFVRMTAAGVADTIALPQPPAGAQQTGVLCRRPDGGLTGISVPEGPGVVYAFPPPGGAIAAAWTAEYRIAFLDPAGDTLRVVTRDHAPAAYSDSLWDAAMQPYRELQENFPGSRCEPSAPSRPRSRAALRHIVFDESGRMWVEAATDDGFAWDVFDADGRLVGSAPAPSRALGVQPFVHGDRLYQVETDDLGVQYVAVYRVGPGR